MNDLPHSNPDRLQRGVRGLRFWQVTVALFAAVLGCVVSVWCWWPNSSEPPLPSVITPRQYEFAREAYWLKHGHYGDRFDNLNWLGEWMLLQKRGADAVECFAAIPSSNPKYGRMARFQQGNTLIDLYRAVEAEKQFREFILLEEASPTIQPEFLIRARQRLRHILEVEVRLEERHKLLRGVIERDEDTTFEPVAGCFPSLVRWSGPDAILWIEHFQATNPDNLNLNIALGRYRTTQGRVTEARQILDPLVREHPENLPALSALIACLNEADDPDEASRIMRTLPPRSPDDPWLLLLQRGADANQNGNPQEAAAAFEQLLEQDRTCSGAWQGLSHAARLLNDIPRSKKAIEMATALGRIQNILGKAVLESSDPNSFLDVADRCAEISLNREGAVMTRCAIRLAPQNERALAAVKLFRERLAEDHELPLLGN
jgi:tetratricopeptide (TPR) repeat protein